MLGGPPTLLSALNAVQALSLGAQAIRVSQDAGGSAPEEGGWEAEV